MSAGVCGKRVGFEEIFGSSSPTACSSAKRSRWSSFGSPTRSEFGSGPEDSASVLLQMFPGVGAEVRCESHQFILTRIDGTFMFYIYIYMFYFWFTV